MLIDLLVNCQKMYVRKLSEVSIYKVKRNQNFTLHKATYIHHLSCDGASNAALDLLSHGFSIGGVYFGESGKSSAGYILPLKPVKDGIHFSQILC